MSVGVSAIPSISVLPAWLVLFLVHKYLRLCSRLLSISLSCSHKFRNHTLPAHRTQTSSCKTLLSLNMAPSLWNKETEQNLLFVMIAPAERHDCGPISMARGPEFTGGSCRSVYSSCGYSLNCTSLDLTQILTPNICTSL